MDCGRAPLRSVPRRSGLREVGDSSLKQKNRSRPICTPSPFARPAHRQAKAIQHSSERSARTGSRSGGSEASTKGRRQSRLAKCKPNPRVAFPAMTFRHEATAPTAGVSPYARRVPTHSGRDAGSDVDAGFLETRQNRARTGTVWDGGAHAKAIFPQSSAAWLQSFLQSPPRTAFHG